VNKNKFSSEEFTERYAAGDRNFEEWNFSGLRFVNCDFSNAVFQKADFSDCFLEKCVFNDSDLTQAIFNRSSIESSSFQSCNMQKALVIASNISFSNFDDCNLQYARFIGSWVSENSFENADLSNANFSFVYEPDGFIYTDGLCAKTVMPDLRLRDDISISEEFEIEDEFLAYEHKFMTYQNSDLELIEICQSGYDILIDNDSICTHLLSNNPFSLEQLVSKLLELNKLGYWTVAEHHLNKLHELSESVKHNEWMD
jgi:Pentapeptide repeats (9 copies)